jgi:hypothetical protein
MPIKKTVAAINAEYCQLAVRNYIKTYCFNFAMLLHVFYVQEQYELGV